MDNELKIDTDRLILRPLEKADFDAVKGYYSSPDIQRYLDWKSRDDVETRLAFEAMRKQKRLTRPGDVLTLAVVRKSDNRLIGHVSLRYTDATAAQGELRFAIAPPYRKHGYATEAVSQLVGQAFGVHRLHRVFARAAGSNQASAALLKKIGMRLEAHYREHALFQGEWDEELHFAILDREWTRGAKVREISRHKVA